MLPRERYVHLGHVLGFDTPGAPTPPPDLPPPPPRTPPATDTAVVKGIQAAVAEHFEVSHTQLVGADRSKGLVKPRHIAMWLCRKHTTLSLPEIGQRFGGRDHTSVLYAVRRIEAAAAGPTDTRREIEAIERIYQVQAAA